MDANSSCLDTVSLSLARYNHCLRSIQKCKIPEADLCPRKHPLDLTTTALVKIKEYVSSKRFAHFRISSPAIFAKLRGDLFPSPATWYRVVRQLLTKAANYRDLLDKLFLCPINIQYYVSNLGFWRVIYRQASL
ncbi:MAG: hypothetical protein HRU19_32295 [Pseudobacteriovorax sp.]|nr:hypothetical protein [Pseudobacteriovorax sp.]